MWWTSSKEKQDNHKGGWFAVVTGKFRITWDIFIHTHIHSNQVLA